MVILRLGSPVDWAHQLAQKCFRGLASILFSLITSTVSGPTRHRRTRYATFAWERRRRWFVLAGMMLALLGGCWIAARWALSSRWLIQQTKPARRQTLYAFHRRGAVPRVAFWRFTMGPITTSGSMIRCFWRCKSKPFRLSNMPRKFWASMVLMAAGSAPVTLPGQWA